MPIGFVKLTQHHPLVDSAANLSELLFNQVKYNETEKTDVKKATKYVYKFEAVKEYKSYAVQFFSKKGKEFVGKIKLEYEYYFLMFDSYEKITADLGHFNFSDNNLMIKYEENGEIKSYRGKYFTYTFEPDANCEFNGFTEAIFYGEITANNGFEKKKVIPATHSYVACYDCDKTLLTKYGLYYNGRGLKLKNGARADIKIHMLSNSEGFVIVGDKSPTNGGKFELSINGVNYGIVDTHLITPYDESQILGSTLYQTPLFSYTHLFDKLIQEEGWIQEKNFTISMKCVDEPVTIAGFVGDFQILPVDDFDYSAHKIPYDPLFDENILPVSNFTSENIDDDPNVDFAPPVNSTFEEILHTCNETDNSTTCNETVNPNPEEPSEEENPPIVVSPSESSSSSSSTESETTSSSSSTESETTSSSSSSTESETTSSSSSTESETTSSSSSTESETTSSSSSTESETTSSSSSTESETTSSSSSTESETTSSSSSTESETTSSSSSTESETTSSSSSTESETTSSSSSTESETTSSSSSTESETTSSSSSTESETTSSSSSTESETTSSSSSTESETTSSSSSTESETTSSSSSTESETTSSSSSTESETTSSSSTESETTSSSSTESETTSSSSSSTESETTSSSSIESETTSSETPVINQNPPPQRTDEPKIESSGQLPIAEDNAPSYTISSDSADSATLSKGALIGVVAGGVVGFIVIAVLIAVIVLHFIKRKPQATAEAEELVDDNDFSLDI